MKCEIRSFKIIRQSKYNGQNGYRKRKAVNEDREKEKDEINRATTVEERII